MVSCYIEMLLSDRRRQDKHLKAYKLVMWLVEEALIWIIKSMLLKNSLKSIMESSKNLAFLLHAQIKLTTCFSIKFWNKWDLYKFKKKAKVAINGHSSTKLINYYKIFKSTPKIFVFSYLLWLEYFISIQLTLMLIIKSLLNTV